MEVERKKPGRLSKAIARIILTVGGLIVGWVISDNIVGYFELSDKVKLISGISGAFLLAVAGFFTAIPILLGLFGLYHTIEKSLAKFSAKEILMGLVGLIVGLVVTIAINILIISPYIKATSIALIVTIVLGLILSFMGMLIGANLLSSIIPTQATNVVKTSAPSNSTAIFILDASSLIDGRVLDIVRTGFISGRLVVPDFVLKEVNSVADSQEMLKKNKGRRGLDILAALQKEKGIKLDIVDNDSPDLDTDSKLIKLAEVLSAPIISVDYNLNKLAAVKSVRILNINDLAKAIKPITLPGEKLNVSIVKEGKERGQGVAFFEDGTMIVVENGGDFVGKEVEVTVTTALQTSAGRMIFARIGQ